MSKQKLRPVGNRTNSMLRRDIYRLLRTPLLYWFVGFSALLPGSFTVMTDPDFQKGFDVWRQVNSLFSSALFMMVGIFLAFFIGNDYKSGSIKNVCSITPRHRAFTIAKVITGSAAGVGVLFLPAMMITLGSVYTMAGLSIAAGLICLAVFPGVAAFIMKQHDIL